MVFPDNYQKFLFRKPLFVQLGAVFGAVGVVKMPENSEGMKLMKAHESHFM